MDKYILVTGASSGIGEATARYLASCSYNLVLVARRKEKLEQLERELETEVLCVPFDLSNTEEIEDIFKTCKEQGIKLSGMVHCAGINRDMPIAVNDIGAMNEVTKINYYAFVELGKFFSKKKYSCDGSSIVAISSQAAVERAKGMLTYAASKAALNVTVGVMAKEFVRRKIRVNAILPNFVDTPMVRPKESVLVGIDEKLEKQPLGIISPLEVAYLAEFLLSDKSEKITGAEIPISGGRLLE